MFARERKQAGVANSAIWAMADIYGRPTQMEKIAKQCCCCGATHTEHGWADLTLLGRVAEDSLELRLCRCGSTLALERPVPQRQPASAAADRSRRQP